jgi:hypothetical protein
MGQSSDRKGGAALHAEIPGGILARNVRVRHGPGCREPIVPEASQRESHGTTSLADALMDTRSCSAKLMEHSIYWIRRLPG